MIGPDEGRTGREEQPWEPEGEELAKKFEATSSASHGMSARHATVGA